MIGSADVSAPAKGLTREIGETVASWSLAEEARDLPHKCTDLGAVAQPELLGGLVVGDLVAAEKEAHHARIGIGSLTERLEQLPHARAPLDFEVPLLALRVFDRDVDVAAGASAIMSAKRSF
jgi:hypothetical protein